MNKNTNTNLQRKILFVIPTLANGGAERILSNIACAFPKEYELSVLLNSVSKDDFPFNGKIICMGMKPQIKKSIYYQMKAFILRYKYLNRLRKENEYDAVISFSDTANVANILTRKGSGKTILSVHIYISEWKSFTYKCIVGPLVKFLYNKADKIVAVSKDIERDLAETFNIKKEKITTINNGVKINKKKKQNTGIVKKDTFRFITMGRLVDQKATWHLIRAFNMVIKSCNKAELVILGEGVNREYLTRLIEDLNLKSRVRLKGFVNNISEELAEADCFVLTSLFEGFPMSLCEAISNGLPVICTDFISGSRDIIAPGFEGPQLSHEIRIEKYGILTPKCSGIHYSAEDELEIQEECLAEAMLRLMNDTELRNGYIEIAPESIERFSINKCVDQWLKVINE